MDDLNQKLERLLSDPDSIAKIQATLSALGGEATPAEPAPAPPTPATPAPTGPAGPDLATLTKLLPLLSDAGQENEDTRLLMALRPYLHGERAGRLEETVKLLRLAKLLPLLQEQGILGRGGGQHNG